MKRWVTLAAALAVLLLLPADVRAGSPTEQLQRFFRAATRVLDGPETQGGPEQRLSTIRAMVRDIFDFREAARLSLGPTWEARTLMEREEFVRLFADLVDRALILGIASRIHVADGVRVSYLGEAVDGALASVWTTIASKSGLDLPYNYRMIDRGDRWAVRDVVIDGVSLAANYRAQFARVIQSSSYLELVRQMQARASSGPTPPVMASVATDGFAFAPPKPPLPAMADTFTDGRASAPLKPPPPAVASVVTDGRASAPFQPSPTMASVVTDTRASAPPKPLPPAVASGVTDGRASAPLKPPPAMPSVVTDARALIALKPPPADVTREEPAEITSRPTPPETPPNARSDDAALDTRSPRRQPPKPILLSWALVTPATTSPDSAAQESSARGEASPTGSRRRLPPAQLQLVSVSRSVSAPAWRARPYWVQVGAFKNPEAAHRLAALLSEQESAGSNRWAVIVDPGSADALLARVRVGPFSGRADAASALHELQSQGYTPFVTEERN